jgi:serine/threonine protein kinase
MPQDAPQRPRTNTRLKAEAPPGMALSGDEGRKSIGRYEVIKTIGKGAMGVVYKARDPLLDRVVAVKTIMSPQQQGRRVRSAFLERFQREAKAAAKMSHPAIVTIFDVGVDEESGARDRPKSARDGECRALQRIDAGPVRTGRHQERDGDRRHEAPQHFVCMPGDALQRSRQ